jgi:hypothetical protein
MIGNGLEMGATDAASDDDVADAIVIVIEDSRVVASP